MRIFDIDIPEILRVKFADLVSSVEIQIWDRLSYGWHRGFEALERFAEIHGHLRVTSTFKTDGGYSLGSWVQNCRTKYKIGSLTPDQIAALEAQRGWIWDISEENFRNGLKHLRNSFRVTGAH